MLRGAFIGFGNVGAKGHLPGWRSRNDVTIVERPMPPRPAGRLFSPRVLRADGTIPSMICCPIRRSISSTSAFRQAATRT